MSSEDHSPRAPYGKRMSVRGKTLCRINGAGVKDVMQKFENTHRKAFCIDGEKQDLALVTDSCMQLRQGLNACDEFDVLLPVTTVRNEEAKEKWKSARAYITIIKEVMKQDLMRDSELGAEIDYALRTWGCMGVKLAPFMSEDKIQFDIREVKQQVKNLKSVIDTLKNKLSEQERVASDMTPFDWDSLLNAFPALNFTHDANGEPIPPEISEEFQEVEHLRSTYEDQLNDFQKRLNDLQIEYDNKVSELDEADSQLRDLESRIGDVHSKLKRAEEEKKECDNDVKIAATEGKAKMERFNKQIDHKREHKILDLDKMRSAHKVEINQRHAETKRMLDRKKATLTKSIVGFNGDYDDCHLYFVLDGSASMKPHWPALRQSFAACMKHRQDMKCNDKVTVIIFSHDAQTVAEGRGINDDHWWPFTKNIIDLVPKECPCGGTSFSRALRQLEAEVRKGDKNHRPVAIFMTDGYCPDGDVQVATNTAASMYASTGQSMIFFGILMSSWTPAQAQGSASMAQVRKIVSAGNGGSTRLPTMHGVIETVQHCGSTELSTCFEEVGHSCEQLVAETKRRQAIVQQQHDEAFAERNQEMLRVEEEYKREEEQIEEDIKIIKRDMKNTQLSKQGIKDIYVEAQKRAGERADDLQNMLSDKIRERDALQSVKARLIEEVERSRNAMSTVDMSSVLNAKRAADDRERRAYEHMMEDTERCEEHRQHMLDNLGTANFHDAAQLLERLRQMMSFSHMVKFQVKEKEVRLRNVIRYLRDTVESIEEPSCSPLRMSTNDKVGLIENVLDDLWDLELEIGDEEHNFERIMDHMWPSYQADAQTEPPDPLFAEALKIIKGSHLKVRDFFESEKPSLVTQAKKTKDNDEAVAADMLLTAEMRIWKDIVEKNANRAVSVKFAEAQRKIDEKEELYDKYDDKDEADEAEQQEVEDVLADFDVQINDLKEELADDELDRDEKKSLRDQIKGIEKAKAQAKKQIKDQRKEGERKLKMLIRELKPVEAELQHFKSQLKLMCQRIIEGLKGAILHPYETFSQHFQKHGIRASYALGFRCFYSQAKAYRYQAQEYKIAFTESVEQRWKAIENREKHAFVVPQEHTLVNDDNGYGYEVVS